jgi:hypothetical protein
MKITEQFLDEACVEVFLEDLHKSISSTKSTDTFDQVSSLVLCLSFEKFNRLINIPTFREGYNYSKGLGCRVSHTTSRDTKLIGLSGDERVFQWKGTVFIETFEEDFQDRVFIVKAKTQLKVEEFTKTGE